MRMTPSFELEAVHLHEHLVQGLLALVVAAAQAGAAVAAHGVDLVDEDDAGGVLLALFEHVAHAGGADAHEHLHEVGAGDGEERHVGFAGDGAGEQGLASAGGTDQQHALRDLATEALELLRVAEELDDLLQLALGLVDAGHVLEGDAALLLGEQPGAALAEAHGPAAARLHLAHEEHPNADQEQHREPGQQVLEQRVDLVLLRPGLHPHALVGQLGDEVRVLGRVGLEGAAVGEGAGHAPALDHHLAHMAGPDLGQEIAVGEVLRPASTRGGGLEEVEQRHQEQRHDDPERQIAAEIIHRYASRFSQGPGSGTVPSGTTPRHHAPKPSLREMGSLPPAPNGPASHVLPRIRASGALNRRPGHRPARKPVRNARMSPGQDKAARAPPPARRCAGPREMSRAAWQAGRGRLP